MKAAVYTGTRNVYEDMLPSIKSMLINTDIDRIFMLIEDDSFICDLPEKCKVINVSKQTYFPKNSVNYRSRWSYMILLRSVYTKIFPEYDRILSMDNDTIVYDDISELWDLDLDNYYFAAVKEPGKTEETGSLYTCIGVAMFNLDLLRKTGMDEKVYRELINVRYQFPEQDVYNKLCKDHILELPAEYGMSNWTTQCDKPKIEHFAATVGMWTHYDRVRQYMNIPFEDIRKE